MDIPSDFRHHELNSTPPWATLLRCLEESVENKSFSSEKFFPKWFRENGRAYFFLFKKNLSVTNIQHAELISLIRQHIFFKASGDLAHGVAFHTTSAFTQTLEAIVRPTLENVNYYSDDLRLLCSVYWPVIERSVVVDSFFTSSAVFLPPHLDLDLVSICGESGYIHSCGYSLFVRRLNKARQAHFYEAISRHLSQHPEYEGVLQFIPYSTEDFGNDKSIGHVKDSLQDGLDGVKVRVEKLHMGKLSLVEVLHEMKERYRARLRFAEPGPYLEKHPRSSESTLWLIADHSINRTNMRALGSERYYICYHQLYHNASPFHLFDENKPAWVAHTTIPHTLLGAMLNVSKPWVPGKIIHIGDPFGGTGTTWLESLKYHDVACTIGDLNPMVSLLLKDNAEIISLDSDALRSLARSLTSLMALVRGRETVNPSEEIQTSLPIDSADVSERFSPAYAKAFQLIQKKCLGSQTPVQSLSFSREDVKLVEQWTLPDRLVFYVALRAELRYQFAYQRGSKQRTAGFNDAASYLIEEIESLADWSESVDASKQNVGIFALFDGHYSRSCSIDRDRLQSAYKTTNWSSCAYIRDARNIEPQRYDLVVTDPPYGFNTVEELPELMKLYAQVIPKLVESVVSGGHLLICLPSEALTGRELPNCTNSKLVTAQVLRAAEDQNREIYTVGSATIHGFSPPYYWNSSALRRTILQFRIR